jgi:hypothetical protein
MIDCFNLSRRLLLTVKALFLLSILLLLAGCGKESQSAAVSGAPENRPSPTVSLAAPLARVEPTSGPPTGEAQNSPTPALPTAEPAATVQRKSAPKPTATPDRDNAGALIQISMESQVGVLLDEIPAAIRDQVAGEIREQSESYWLALAQEQVHLTRNRLNFRNFVYPGKGQLPLPPEEVWSIRLHATEPERQTIQGHDLVMIGYTFNSTLLTDMDSPGQAEPALAEVGGVWLEPFIFPADPHLLLQRTGNACINEGGFPPNSFDSQNIWIFYDYSCEADSAGAAGCHRTRLPRLSCREALQERIGEIETAMRFERLAWDSELADTVRVEAGAAAESPDLMVVGEDLETNRIVYRYIEPDDCALLEGAVGGSGWRRLLQFSATVANIGGQALDIGPVVAEDLDNHVFTYNSCHDHFHYSNYGEFSLGSQDLPQNSKQAFCVQSTSRFSNNEVTPLVHNYSCRLQGIEAGWVDEYVAGLDTQWVDITDMDIPPEGLVAELTFTSNSDQFLCEGTPVSDENGEVVWVPSGFATADGEIINRPECEFTPDWESNNRSSRDVFLPQRGSFVSEPCLNGAFSPLRNCGFIELPEEDHSCTPGTTVERSFRLEAGDGMQALRVCERSDSLGSGLACTYEESLANVIVGNEPAAVTFVCPQVRDAQEFEGDYALYTAPIWPLDAPQAIVADQQT